MSEKTDVWQGTLELMVLKTLEALGPLRGYGIARRIEQISENKNDKVGRLLRTVLTLVEGLGRNESGA